MAMEQAAAQSEKGRILTIFRVMFNIGSMAFGGG